MSDILSVLYQNDKIMGSRLIKMHIKYFQFMLRSAVSFFFMCMGVCISVFIPITLFLFSNLYTDAVIKFVFVRPSIDNDYEGKVKYDVTWTAEVFYFSFALNCACITIYKN